MEIPITKQMPRNAAAVCWLCYRGGNGLVLRPARGAAGEWRQPRVVAAVVGYLPGEAAVDVGRCAAADPRDPALGGGQDLGPAGRSCR